MPATGLVLLSLGDGSVKHTASVGTDPVAVIVSEDGSTAYIADSSPGDVYAFDLVRRQGRWKAHLGGAPFGLLLHDGHLFASLFRAATVVELDPGSGAQLATHAVPQGPGAMAIDPQGHVVVATAGGRLGALDGTSVPAGKGYGVASAGDATWTAGFTESELVRAGDPHIVRLPLPVTPFWLAPAAGGKLLVAAEGPDEDADPGGVFLFDPSSETFQTLAQPRDPDQVIQSEDTVFVAAHGDRRVLAIKGGQTSPWAQGASAVALATDAPLGLLVVAVNAHE